MAKGKQATKASDDYITVEEDAYWLFNEIPQDFADKHFFRIVLFYVLHSPCKKGSFTRVDLEKEYNWKNPWYSDRFKELLNTVVGFNNNTFLFSESKKAFREMWERCDFNDVFWINQAKEFAVFSHVGESNPHLDLLHHIRNCLAHGRFTARRINKSTDYYIYMEDVDEVSRELRVTARIAFKKSSLLKWIDIFECRTEEAKELCRDLLLTNNKNGKQNATPASTSSLPTRKN